MRVTEHLRTSHYAGDGADVGFRTIEGCAWCWVQKHGTTHLTMADDRACLAKSPLAAVIASKMRKDDSVEGSVIFTFHAIFPKRKGSIKSGSCKPEASIVLSYIEGLVKQCHFARA